MRTENETTRTRHSRGMTLIEMTVALVLAVLLMSALAGVLKSLRSLTRKVEEQTGPSGWQPQLRDLLRWDLANARTVRLSPGRFEFLGYASREFNTGAATYLPAHVVYQLYNRGGRNWLARSETHLNSLSNDNRRRALICEGVAKMQIERPDEAPPGQRQASGYFEIPHRLRVELVRDDGVVLLDEIMILKAPHQ